MSVFIMLHKILYYIVYRYFHLEKFFDQKAILKNVF